MHKQNMNKQIITFSAKIMILKRFWKFGAGK